MTQYFDPYAKDFDRIQPVKIEMYDFYHRLALDVVPFEPDQPFRFADLGCGTGTFLSMVLERFPNSNGVAVELSEQMRELAAEKTEFAADRVRFLAHDLNAALPSELSELDMVTTFSTIHHLPDERKRSIFREIHDSLKPGGWLILLDAMYVPYNEKVWDRAREREDAARAQRMAEAGIDPEDHHWHEQARHSLDESSPERDRISGFDLQRGYLNEAGFSSVDEVWHYWMEHLVIAKR